ncbi:MAG: hypothetical protein ACHQJD_00320 [Thermoanaerobaculia bacterium]
MKKLLALAGVLVATLVLVTMAGSWMEPRHVVSRTRRFAASPERVWTALLSIRQLPFDRSDLREMERAPDKDRVPPSIEVLGSPVSIYAPIEHPPAELLVKTTEEGLAYSGSWRFQLSQENDYTRVAVTEDAEIHSRPLRFVVGQVLGEDVLIESVFRALTRKLSEAPRMTGGD